MILFLLACIPLCVLFAYCVQKKAIGVYIPALCFGLFAGIFFCFVHGFFAFPSRMVSASYADNLFKTLLFYNLLPQLALCGFFLLVSRDTAAYKREAYFPLVASFFAVFVPYRILRAPFIPGAYELFVLPLMYALQIVVIARCLKLIVPAFAENQTILEKLALCLCFLVFLVLPQTAEALRAITPRMLLCGMLTGMFFAGAGGFLFLRLPR
jgi:hypothetical protein